MYVLVKLLHGMQEPLVYHVPNTMHDSITSGVLVRVPLRARVEVGIITACPLEKPNVRFIIKDLISIEPFPPDVHFMNYIKTLAAVYGLDPLYCLSRLKSSIANRTEQIRVGNPISGSIQTPVIVTPEQEKVVQFLHDAIVTPSYTPVLLHGVTGSGKTEVYKKAITTALAQRKSILFLLPEVTLALEFERLLRMQSPEMPLYGFHSASSTKQKGAVWNLLLNSHSVVLIGVHVPIMLPIANLGLIIVDEEHETGYQEKKHPKINSKEAALIRAQKYNIPIVLGSATPSITSLYNVHMRGWKYFQLKQRFSGSFPSIKTVYLSENKERKHFWITKELQEGIKDRLRKREQTILFLNRRGYSFFVQCKACSWVCECGACAVSLTVHADNRLRCHYCNYERTFPALCPKCSAPEKELLKKGVGTQQIVSLVQNMFPDARIARADLDSTKKKKAWSQTVADFNAGSIDIIVGTQTITKGFHFPNVTLVGIIWADINFSVPFYNATETALQQLIQVAGRAGRGEKKSEVIVQAMGKHEVLSFIDEYRYLSLYDQELQIRKNVGYPPFVRFIELEFKHTDQECVAHEAHQVSVLLQQLALPECTVLGPVMPPVSKIQRMYLRKIYIKTSDIFAITGFFRELKDQFSSQIALVLNPLS